MILKTTCSGPILLRLYLQFGELASPSSAPCFCLVRQFSPLRLKIGVVSDFVALSFVAEMTKFGEKVTLDSETKLWGYEKSDQIRLWWTSDIKSMLFVERVLMDLDWLDEMNSPPSLSHPWSSRCIFSSLFFSCTFLHTSSPSWSIALNFQDRLKLSWIPPPALSLKTFRWPVFIIADREASYFLHQHLSKTIKSNQNDQSVNHFRHFCCSQL